MACVADPAAVERLVFAEDGLLGAVRPGFRYLECSTVSPDTTRRVQAALRERGADALEAPVTGSKNGAENGTLLFMTGGDAAVHEELLPVMMAMGTKAIHCGEMGQGSTVKLIGNSVISFMLEALCEGIVLGRKAGLPLETIVEVIQASGYASPYYAFKGAAIAKRDFQEHFAIDLLVKDQTLMLEQAAALKVPDARPRRDPRGLPGRPGPGPRPRGHLRGREGAGEGRGPVAGPELVRHAGDAPARRKSETIVLPGVSAQVERIARPRRCTRVPEDDRPRRARQQAARQRATWQSAFPAREGHVRVMSGGLGEASVHALSRVHGYYVDARRAPPPPGHARTGTAGGPRTTGGLGPSGARVLTQATAMNAASTRAVATMARTTLESPKPYECRPEARTKFTPR